MFLKTFYFFTQLIPRWVQIGIRRRIVLRKRALCGDSWPIDETAGMKPSGWGGWPQGKQFAVVLTHDVECEVGLEKVIQLADIDTKYGFKASFNFVAEGYTFPAALREQLVARGFEVGVHGLKHDRSLYRSEQAFREQAVRINHYLREWCSEGFRSPSMYHNLDWLGNLDISYDSSTFDTDPFEPQPDGVGTIFPFLVRGGDQKKLYVELPYTLPQDFTVFILMREKTIDIWKKKLDWIASRGGMALINVHPDYMGFCGKEPGIEQYSSDRYEEFLSYVAEKYEGRFWNALPKDVAHHCRHSMTASASDQTDTVKSKQKKIWIDLDNTPHVPFFIPIKAELEKRGYNVILTARDAFQVCELADRNKLNYMKIGKHYGKHMVLKLLGLVWRSFQLLPFIVRERPDIALSHGARSQIFLCNILRIPSVLILDYEHSSSPPLCHPKWIILPEALPDNKAYSSKNREFKYSGLKEDVYAQNFTPNPSLFDELGLHEDDFIVTMRPPANEAHYRNHESDVLFEELMKIVQDMPEVRTVLLPRNKSQEALIRSHWPEWFARGKTIVPSHAVNGMNLLWYSDLVVSGGGTMNREAAALGVPVYSIFRGKTGAIDRQLENDGRLVMIHSKEELRKKIDFKRRDKSWKNTMQPRRALTEIVNHIETIIRQEAR